VIFASFWHVRIEVFVKLYSPFAGKSPLIPLFQREKLTHDNYFPLFEKACPERSRREGPGEILDKCELFSDVSIRRFA
jgi:hypothetical protein